MDISQNLHLPGSWCAGKKNSKYEGDLIQIIGKDNLNYPVKDVIKEDKSELYGIFIKKLDLFYSEFYHRFG
jgi:hypothetical protein